MLTDAAEREIANRVRREVDLGTEVAETAPAPDPTTAGRYVYYEPEFPDGRPR